VNRQGDPDDWFGGAPDGASAEEGRSPSAFEDWLREDEASAPRRFPQGLDRRILIGIAVAIVALIAILAAAGVFSGSSHNSTPPPATTTVQTTAPPPQTTPAPSVTAPKTPLKPGDTGPQVKALQHALTSLGYSTGGADGQYGAKTEAAVKQFQSAHNLTADGIAGAKTLQALATALRSKG
jgi:hypothetical protein